MNFISGRVRRTVLRQQTANINAQYQRQSGSLKSLEESNQNLVSNRRLWRIANANPLYSFTALFFLRLNDSKPTKPLPNNQTVPGTGTADTGVNTKARVMPL